MPLPPSPPHKNRRTHPKIVPWMVGHNAGRIFYVLVFWIRNIDGETNLFDTLPHIIHITLYSVILDNKVFGMLATFQMLFESHFFYDSPKNILQLLHLSTHPFYHILELTTSLFFIFFCTRKIATFFSKK